MTSKLHIGFYITSLNPYTRAINKGEKMMFIQIPLIIFSDHLLAEYSDNIKRSNGKSKAK